LTIHTLHDNNVHAVLFLFVNRFNGQFLSLQKVEGFLIVSRH